MIWMAQPLLVQKPSCRQYGHGLSKATLKYLKNGVLSSRSNGSLSLLLRASTDSNLQHSTPGIFVDGYESISQGMKGHARTEQ